MVLKNLFTGQQWRNRHREQTYEHGERGGESEMYGKSNMETYITICKIDMFPIMNPAPSSLPVPYLWVIPVHQPQVSTVMH